MLIFFLLNLIILSSIGIISSINSIYSILFLILSFILSSFFLLLLNLEFFALIFIIIYVGAISVFFLFIIMIINFKQVEKENINYLMLSVLLLFLLILLFVLVLLDNNDINNKYIILENDYMYFMVNNLDESNKINIIINLAYILFYLKPMYIIVIGLVLFLIMLYSIYLTNIKQNFNLKLQVNQLLKKFNYIKFYIL